MGPSAGPGDRPLLHIHAGARQMVGHLIQRGGGDQAQVAAAGGRAGRVRGELLARLVQVYLARAERQARRPASKVTASRPSARW
jgi:hypothetical protein